MLNNLLTLLLQQEEQSRLELSKSEQYDYDTVLICQKRFIQKKQKHQRSYLQIAKSLKRKQQDLDEYYNKFITSEDKKQDALSNQPSNLVFDIKLCLGLGGDPGGRRRLRVARRCVEF